MKIVLIVLSFILAFASCGMFDQGKAGRDTNLIGSDGQGTVLCETSADCDSDEVCNSNGVCVDNPILGAACTTNSDCGSSILYTCNNGTCQKTTIQEAEAEAEFKPVPLQKKDIGESCTVDSDCEIGICDPEILANGTVSSTKTCGRTSGGTNYGRGVCNTDCASECKSGQTISTVTVLGTAVCIINSGGCKFFCAQSTGQVCHTATTNYGFGTINNILPCKSNGIASGCSASSGNFGVCN